MFAHKKNVSPVSRAQSNLTENSEEAASARLDKGSHPAQNRLINDLPNIINLARRQAEGALRVLSRPHLDEKHRHILNVFFGDSTDVIRSKLIEILGETLAALQTIRPSNFDVAEELYEAGGGAIAYIRDGDSERFKKSSDGKYINISYISAGRKHVEDIASTIVHEVTHLALNTEDHEYGDYVKVPSQFDAAVLEKLRKYAQTDPQKAINNAESISRAASLLYFSSSQNFDHKKLYELFLKSDSQNVLAFHRLDGGGSPRISSPELARKINTIRKIGGHLVI
ncbi:hypothetical protein [Burkholderia stagnalis]|uniref:hypothetical protein n=1 Tax=Burkholderia stagnalis TaxID=1503054 RepID=UPI0009BECB84|nr:hypothetical protein [Burkholderia stagnalis]MDY7806701.1 hypothetical protein [Burkholderia stagnalis]